MVFFFHLYTQEYGAPRCVIREGDPEQRVYYINALTHGGRWGRNLLEKLDVYNLVMEV